jgi:hypothetical protein
VEVSVVASETASGPPPLLLLLLLLLLDEAPESCGGTLASATPGWLGAQICVVGVAGGIGQQRSTGLPGSVWHCSPLAQSSELGSHTPPSPWLLHAPIQARAASATKEPEASRASEGRVRVRIDGAGVMGENGPKS